MFEPLENYEKVEEKPLSLNKESNILTEDKSKWYSGEFSEKEIKAKESEFWEALDRNIINFKKNLISSKAEISKISTNNEQQISKNYNTQSKKSNHNKKSEKKEILIRSKDRYIHFPKTSRLSKELFSSLEDNSSIDTFEFHDCIFEELYVFNSDKILNLRFVSCKFIDKTTFEFFTTTKHEQEISFLDCSFDRLILKSLDNNSDIKSLIIANCKGIIELYNLKILNQLNFSFLDFENSYIEKLDLSQTKEIIFNNISFKRAEKININFGNIKELLSKFPTNGKESSYKNFRSSFCSLKHFYDEMANYIDANICYEIEMQIYEKELEAKKWLNVPNWINKFIDKTFSLWGILSILIFINIIPTNETFLITIFITLFVLISTLLFCNKYLTTASNETAFQEKFILRFAKLISNFSNSWLRPLGWALAVVVIFSSFTTPNIDYTSTNQTPAIFLNAFDENRQITDFDIKSKTNLNSYNKSAHFLLISNSNEKVLNEKNLTFAYDDRFNYSFKEQYIPMLKDDIWTKIYFSLSNSISPFISSDKAWFSKTTTKAIVTSTIELILLWFSLGAFFVAVKRKLRR